MNAESRKKCKYKCKKLNSLKHCVKSQITRLKLQKIILWYRSWCISLWI